MKTELLIGIVVVVVMLLNLVGLLSVIGITQRFVDILVIFVGIYLIIKGK